MVFQVQSFSNKYIDATVQFGDLSDYWRFTGIYGEPEVGQQGRTWELLSRLSSQSARPWLSARDFNEILQRSEKEGGLPRPPWQMQNFRLALQNAGLHGGGLALLREKTMVIQVQYFSNTYIDATVQFGDLLDYWRFTGIYGEPEVGQRGRTWGYCLGFPLNLLVPSFLLGTLMRF
ncbi:UNVERIFIED_CONTAM: hypothetical protein Sangu_2775200 [Sesamum angustifolium]|uniref:Uncharacterized protein n=1 Tax=Sesamum angustifolium TaxID=2727405 RepID=A0AAW2ITR0_9LAMI